MEEETETATMPLVQNSSGISLKHRRPKKKGDSAKIPLRWKYITDLYLSGVTPEAISKMVGLGKQTIYAILRDQRVIHYKQQIMQAYDMEFESLYGQVVDSVRTSLVDPDPRVKLDAAKIWLKAHGRIQPNEIHKEGDTNLSAEKIVFQILNQKEARQ